MGVVCVGRLAPVQTVTTNLILELLKLPCIALLFFPCLEVGSYYCSLLSQYQLVTAVPLPSNVVTVFLKKMINIAKLINFFANQSKYSLSIGPRDCTYVTNLFSVLNYKNSFILSPYCLNSILSKSPFCLF